MGPKRMDKITHVLTPQSPKNGSWAACSNAWVLRLSITQTTMAKKHTKPNLPPGCPIISGCGSITDNISLFIDHHSKHLVLKSTSYLQDTPDLLRQIEK
jgi:hypothetical protein